MTPVYVAGVRLPKEILVLLVLMLVMAAGVLWYVIDRRAKMKAGRQPAPSHAPAKP